MPTPSVDERREQRDDLDRLLLGLRDAAARSPCPTAGMKTARVSAQSSNQFIGAIPLAARCWRCSRARLRSPTAANRSSA